MGLSDIFQDIANAIRSKTGKSESIYPVDMASEIEGISSGGGYKLEKMPSGAVSSFNDGTDLPLNKLKVSIEPVQDLHGYDAPWVGGAGKNKFDVDLSHEKSLTTYIYTVRVKPNTSYTMSSNVPQGNPASLYFNGGTTNVNGVWSDTPRTFTSDANGDLTVEVRYNTIQGGIDLYTAVKNGTYYIQLEEGSTATTFVPYSNICPISGWDGVNVTVANDVDNPTISNVYTIDLDGTRYGGTLDVVSGVLTVTNANIASYNGEIINEPWISSMDVYSAGATPTTGAQVVYPLATPQTIQLTPTAVRSLIELNNIWADTGDIINGEYFKEVG